MRTIVAEFVKECIVREVDAGEVRYVARRRTEESARTGRAAGALKWKSSRDETGQARTSLEGPASKKERGHDGRRYCS